MHKKVRRRSGTKRRGSTGKSKKEGVRTGDKTDVRLMRPKSRMTEAEAWQSISKSTGLSKSKVRPAHTKKAWRWVKQ